MTHHNQPLTHSSNHSPYSASPEATVCLGASTIALPQKKIHVTGLKYDPGMFKTKEYDKQLYCSSANQYNANIGTRNRGWYQNVVII